MPRWLPRLVLILAVLLCAGVTAYLVMEWNVRDPLEVHLVNMKGAMGDRTATLTYEVRNTSRFPVRFVSYAHTAHQDGEFLFHTENVHPQPLVLKSGDSYSWDVKLTWDHPATGEENGTMHVFWSPPSARWLGPVFDSIHGQYMNVRPGAARFMPHGGRSLNSGVLKFQPGPKESK
jgi:hypothetical protein